MRRERSLTVNAHQYFQLFCSPTFNCSFPCLFSTTCPKFPSLTPYECAAAPLWRRCLIIHADRRRQQRWDTERLRRGGEPKEGKMNEKRRSKLTSEIITTVQLYTPSKNRTTANENQSSKNTEPGMMTPGVVC